MLCCNPSARCVAVVLLASIVLMSQPGSGSTSVHQQPTRTVNWNVSTGESKLLPTLQVVVNPLMNHWTTPITSNVWKSLKELNATRVRFAGWFPYPQWSVVELSPPTNQKTAAPHSSSSTSWNFTGLMSQLAPFMASVNPPSVLCVSTAPLWMFADPSSVPWSADPRSNDVSWGYAKGQFLSNSTYQMADYFASIASYLIRGEAIDEFGHKITGGPAYDIERIGTWEVFNEPEYELRGGGPADYVASYDAIVRRIRELADPDRKLQFQGLALQYHQEWDWWSMFLDPSKHDPAVRDAIDWASFHFYSCLHDRVDNSSWESELFQTCDDFVVECEKIVALRNTLNPSTKLSIDEMGSILAHDNDKASPPPSALYYVASGALFAYAFGRISPLRIDLLGMSQLAGTVAMPQWGIPDPQYPSVSMLDWTTGDGNARYWTLFLIRKYFGVGDLLFDVPLATRPRPCASTYMLDLIGYKYPHFAFVQCSAVAPITKVLFAAQGDISGYCDDTQFVFRNKDCHDHGAVMKFVNENCIGKPHCTVDSAAFKEYFANCSSTYMKRLVISVECQGDGVGIGTPSAYLSDQIFVQGRRCAIDGRRRLLVVNKNNAAALLTLSGLAGSTGEIVDATSQGRPHEVPINEDQLVLQAFASGIISLPL